MRPWHAFCKCFGPVMCGACGCILGQPNLSTLSFCLQNGKQTQWSARHYGLTVPAFLHGMCGFGNSKKPLVAACRLPQVVCEGRLYMRWLSNKLEAAGVTQTQRRLASIAELAGEPWDLVINCCGLGSKDLLPDPHCYPIRGQIMRVKAPWVNQSVFAEFPDHSMYIIPNRWVERCKPVHVGIGSTWQCRWQYRAVRMAVQDGTCGSTCSGVCLCISSTWPTCTQRCGGHTVVTLCRGVQRCGYEPPNPCCHCELARKKATQCDSCNQTCSMTQR